MLTNIALPEHGIGFYLIPKAAGSSIKWALCLATGREPTPDTIHGGWDIRPDFPSQWLRFAIVRDPFSRLVSCWWQKLHGGGASKLETMGFSRRMTFDAFVDLVCRIPDAQADHHFRSQSATIHGDPQIIHCERLDRYWPLVQKQCAARGLLLPPITRRNTSQPPAIEWTADLVAKIAHRYAEDIRRGY